MLRDLLSYIISWPKLVPDERDAWTNDEILLGDDIPTATISVPVHVAGMDDVAADARHHRHMPVAAGSLGAGLQDHDRADMWLGRDDPASHGGPGGPLIGITCP